MNLVLASLLHMLYSLETRQPLRKFTDIEAGTYLDLLIETTASLGNIQVVVVGIEVGLPNPWFIQYTGVYNLCDDDIEENRFPCYHWIKADTSVTTTSKTGMCV